MKSKQLDITDEEFDNELFRLMSDVTAVQLINNIPGIYESVAEYYNNEIIDNLSLRVR